MTTSSYSNIISPQAGRFVALGLGLALAIPVGGRAQTPAADKSSELLKQESIELPTFEVVGSKDRGYRASNSVSATRIATPIADLPFSVTALTSEFITDISASNIYEIASYASNVRSSAPGFNAGNSGLIVRGFGVTPLRDGIVSPQFGNTYIETSVIERVEVVKGPASLLYGPLGPGGVVNYVTKKAQTKAFTTITGQVGTLNSWKTAIDINRPLSGETVLFRVNANWDQDFVWRDPSKVRNKSFAPTVTWNFNKNVSFRASYQYYLRDETPQPVYHPAAQVGVTPESVVDSLYRPGYGSPSGELTGVVGRDVAATNPFNNIDLVNGSTLYPDRFNYSSDQNYLKYSMEIVDLELVLNLNDRWVARMNLDLPRGKVSNFQTGIGTVFVPTPNSMVYSAATGWSVAPSWAALTSAEKIAREIAFAQAANADQSVIRSAMQNGTASPWIMGRRPRLQIVKQRAKTFQIDLAGKYTFPWGKIQPLFGFSLSDGNGPHLVTRQNNSGSLASPWFRTWDINPASPTYYVNHNEPIDPNALTNRSQDNTNLTTDKAAYAVVNGSLFRDRLLFVAGARYNENRAQTQNFINNTLGTDWRTHRASPQVGVGFKLLPDVMLYASYSTSYQPSNSVLQVPAIVNGVQTSVPGEPARPFQATGYEAGIKTSMLDGRLSSTLAVYQTTLTDQLRTINPFVNGQTIAITFQGNETRSRGVEFEINYSATQNLQILGNMTLSNTIDSFEPAGFKYFEGSQIQGTAKTLGALWARYNFSAGSLKGLWFGGGPKYTGKTAGLTSSNVNYFLPAFWDVNAVIGYDWTVDKVKWTASVNVNNLTDSRQTPAYAWFRMPRRATFTIRTTF
ncbi:MAG: TonB-dependent receptor [Opitutae bacterium]|nr:TonB-dependent receptor [Opitutae bacterium]